ncbi:hypothetical protein STCU_09913 [Strigomonas culicis]|uniref:Uncharacterized protein n=1 Tax=Strigomonas culicis TaxID=28005 RepID=S9TPP7_9TRYP|nr:hypothetical protein STCU_09913 [Strigomonas culicis]|eukprot:EPY18438.1 hypothetical protein STCU_09913 [Strigomonas culicis]
MEDPPVHDRAQTISSARLLKLAASSWGTQWCCWFIAAYSPCRTSDAVASGLLCASIVFAAFMHCIAIFSATMSDWLTVKEKESEGFIEQQRPAQ